MKKKFDGFTLTETLIMIGIVGVIALVSIVSLMNIKPNKDKMMLQKAYKTTASVISELINNPEYYPATETQTSFFFKIKSHILAAYSSGWDASVPDAVGGSSTECGNTTCDTTQVCKDFNDGLGSRCVDKTSVEGTTNTTQKCYGKTCGTGFTLNTTTCECVANERPNFNIGNNSGSGSDDPGSDDPDGTIEADGNAPSSGTITGIADGSDKAWTGGSFKGGKTGDDSTGSGEVVIGNGDSIPGMGTASSDDSGGGDVTMGNSQDVFARYADVNNFAELFKNQVLSTQPKGATSTVECKNKYCSFTTSDGMKWEVTDGFVKGDATSTSTVFVDINGDKKPNKAYSATKPTETNVDQFTFTIHANGQITVPSTDAVAIKYLKSRKSK